MSTRDTLAEKDTSCTTRKTGATLAHEVLAKPADAEFKKTGR